MRDAIPYYPLKESRDLDPLMDAIGDARIVLLGEASHGTHEYYTWRTAISKRLIKEKGFRFISVEGDWPDCYNINRYIKGYKSAGITTGDVLKVFRRWPGWMWGNWEVAALAEWLKSHNAHVKPEERVGFYGIDMYSLWESLGEILSYLERYDGSSVQLAREAFHCFEPYHEDPQEYARSTSLVPSGCEDQVVKLLGEVINKRKAMDGDDEGEFNLQQNALVTVNAERYYREMIKGGPGSWNVRDTHMVESLDRLIEHHDNAKCIVWEHNTHVGDARATDMARNGMVNVGQLVREKYGRDNVFIAGFGSYEGSVIAGSSWGAPMQEMTVPEARKGSWEDILHNINDDNKLILTAEAAAAAHLDRPLGHRAIGVVYHPAYETYGNYVPTVIPERYDAFLYIDTTKALHPVHIKADTTRMPDLYPWYY